MPDHRTTGRALAEDAVHAAVARTGIDQAQQPDETTEPLLAQPLDLLNRLVEDTTRVSQEFTDRATRNVQALIDLTEVSTSGWQQAVSELSQQMQQAIADQTQMFNAAFQVCRPEQLFDVHSDFVTARLQAQLGTSARLAQITADLTAQAARRLQLQA
jgi:glycerol-3-phosphate dehydrogenase